MHNLKTARTDSLGSRLFNPAGGVAYHWRAMRYRRTLWRPFRSQIENWLSRWQPPEKHLALMGPSAGYNLPLMQLQRYLTLTVFEPDPLACWLFSRRLHQALGSKAPRLTFARADHLVQRPHALLEFFEGTGPTAVLFCNVLGQVTQLVSESNQKDHLLTLKQSVSQVLVGRSWASFHDRVSGPLAPKAEAFAAARRWSNAQVVAHGYDPERADGAVELIDHATDGYFPDELPCAYFSWQIAPSSWHLIEAVQQHV